MILQRQPSTEHCRWYRLGPTPQDDFHRWVASTPQNRSICNDPAVCGRGFVRGLSESISASLSSAPFLPWLSSFPSSRLCIMNFLRGGLNFDLTRALEEAVGSRHHVTCFMSSQRTREDGRWSVKEDMYRKIRIPDGAVLLVGDVVATGVTLENGLEVLLDSFGSRTNPLSGLVFFTIGGPRLETILHSFHQRAKERFEHYGQTHVVYLEGRMTLADAQCPLSFAIPGTDLIKVDALLAPEFEDSQADSRTAALERCVIYDAGSRAFDVLEYLEDVQGFWKQLLSLSQRGRTYLEVLLERFPAAAHQDGRSYLEQRRKDWPDVPEEEILTQFERRTRWLDAIRRDGGGTPELLESVCRKALKKLKDIEKEATRS